MPSQYSDILARIEAAIEAARAVFGRFTPGEIAAEYKRGLDPVTEADLALDKVLHKELLREGEGWLSEESVDDASRLDKKQVWVVDPLDGTREFVAGIPEFCVSIGFVENGRPVAGGICNPASGETIVGAIDCGVTYNGEPARISQRENLSGAVILASRNEIKRGEWRQFSSEGLQVKAVGSVAYKLALVAAGRADATFTLTPKNEWDIMAGAALVEGAGGFVATLDKAKVTGNRRNPRISGLMACGPFLKDQLTALLERHISISEQAR